MSEKARYRISLRITHPNIRSEEISAQLGFVPDIAYTAGDGKFTPKGNEISGARKETFWCYELLLTRDESFEVAISKFSKQLATSKTFLDELASTGGHLEYFIGWFSSENSGLVLEDCLLKLLADLRISLAFDIYVEPPAS